MSLFVWRSWGAGPSGGRPTWNRRETFHFIDCILGRTRPLITPEETWTDQAIAEAIYAGSQVFHK